ncbi:pirin family protein [Sphingomonas bacterium]|uniref:pirin family protein n=1 Tax=Sphingomonas bacterium TaxID=1895847 RepID=UPI0015772A5F|nr:pirin-like C-terminal cupin domain-containing protein [Sphingomonas bacterium]
MPSSLEAITPAGAYRQLKPGLLNREVFPPRDPARTSPFIVLAEDLIEPGMESFGMHPHRGFETVMLQLKGSNAFEDSLGDTGVTGPGDVEWTCAGRGILHGGRPVGDERLHSLQLWLNLPAALKTAPPGMRNQSFADTPTIRKDGVTTTVYAGRHGGVVQPHLSLWPLTLIETRLDAGRSVTFEIGAGTRAFAYVVDGAATVDGAPVAGGHVAWFRRVDEASTATLTAQGGAHLVYYASVPIDEPVALGGPFVMNSEAEIQAAYADLKAGRIGR